MALTININSYPTSVQPGETVTVNATLTFDEPALGLRLKFWTDAWVDNDTGNTDIASVTSGVAVDIPITVKPDAVDSPDNFFVVHALDGNGVQFGAPLETSHDVVVGSGGSGSGSLGETPIPAGYNLVHKFDFGTGGNIKDLSDLAKIARWHHADGRIFAYKFNANQGAWFKQWDTDLVKFGADYIGLRANAPNGVASLMDATMVRFKSKTDPAGFWRIKFKLGNFAEGMFAAFWKTFLQNVWANNEVDILELLKFSEDTVPALYQTQLQLQHNTVSDSGRGQPGLVTKRLNTATLITEDISAQNITGRTVPPSPDTRNEFLFDSSAALVVDFTEDWNWVGAYLVDNGVGNDATVKYYIGEHLSREQEQGLWDGEGTAMTLAESRDVFMLNATVGNVNGWPRAATGEYEIQIQTVEYYESGGVRKADDGSDDEDVIEILSAPKVVGAGQTYDIDVRWRNVTPGFQKRIRLYSVGAVADPLVDDTPPIDSTTEALMVVINDSSASGQATISYSVGSGISLPNGGAWVATIRDTSKPDRNAFLVDRDAWDGVTVGTPPSENEVVPEYARTSPPPVVGTAQPNTYFSDRSVWRMPIANNADRQPLHPSAQKLTASAEEKVYVVKPEASDSEAIVYKYCAPEYGETTNRTCINDTAIEFDSGFRIKLPAGFSIPDEGKNNCLVVFDPDSPEEILQFNSTAVFNGDIYCAGQGNGLYHNDSRINIYSSGAFGAQAGTNLSALGGVIWPDELDQSNADFGHALKIMVNARDYYAETNSKGHRVSMYPAFKSDGDSGSVDYIDPVGGATHDRNWRTYTGQGMHLTVVANATAASLGLTHPFVIQTFNTLKKYGAYQTEQGSFAGTRMKIAGTQDFDTEFQSLYGHSIIAGNPQGSDYPSDPTLRVFVIEWETLYRALHVVVDNTHKTPGGGRGWSDREAVQPGIIAGDTYNSNAVLFSGFRPTPDAVTIQSVLGSIRFGRTSASSVEQIGSYFTVSDIGSPAIIQKSTPVAVTVGGNTSSNATSITNSAGKRLSVDVPASAGLFRIEIGLSGETVESYHECQIRANLSENSRPEEYGYVDFRFRDEGWVYCLEVQGGSETEQVTIDLENNRGGGRNLEIAYATIESVEWSGTQSQVAKPIINPGSGDFIGTQEVSLWCATSGATIYYSINGGGYNVYSAPFAVSVTSTVSSYATNAGETDSATTSATYTLTTSSDREISPLAPIGTAIPVEVSIIFDPAKHNCIVVISAWEGIVDRHLYVSLGAYGFTKHVISQINAGYPRRVEAFVLRDNLPTTAGTYNITLSPRNAADDLAWIKLSGLAIAIGNIDPNGTILTGVDSLLDSQAGNLSVTKTLAVNYTVIAASVWANVGSTMTGGLTELWSQNTDSPSGYVEISENHPSGNITTTLTQGGTVRDRAMVFLGLPIIGQTLPAVSAPFQINLTNGLDVNFAVSDHGDQIASVSFSIDLDNMAMTFDIGSHNRQLLTLRDPDTASISVFIRDPDDDASKL